MLSWVRGVTYHHSSFQRKTKSERCRDAPCFVQEAPVRETAGIAIVRYSSQTVSVLLYWSPQPCSHCKFHGP